MGRGVIPGLTRRAWLIIDRRPGSLKRPHAISSRSRAFSALNLIGLPYAAGAGILAAARSLSSGPEAETGQTHVPAKPAGCVSGCPQPMAMTTREGGRPAWPCEPRTARRLRSRMASDTVHLSHARRHLSRSRSLGVQGALTTQLDVSDACTVAGSSMRCWIARRRPRKSSISAWRPGAVRSVARLVRSSGSARRSYSSWSPRMGL